MDDTRAKWAIYFNLTSRLELGDAAVGVWDGDTIRTVARWATGPFDTPEDILQVMLEMIQHAEWKGEQLHLPVEPSQN